jgi:murein DD-endopeptidase MepM/ murein hydrolase activator NlpD
VVTASVRRQESESERLQDPNAAYLRTGFEKELMFKEGQITLTGKDQGLHIYLDQKQGITIESPSELALQADNNLTLQAGRNLVISAQGDQSVIKLNYKDGKVNNLVLNADGGIGFKGKVEKESGSGEPNNSAPVINSIKNDENVFHPSPLTSEENTTRNLGDSSKISQTSQKKNYTFSNYDETPSGQHFGDDTYTNSYNIRFPVKGNFPITSGYGWRFIFGKESFHPGIDIGVDEVSVFLPARGRILYSGSTNGGWGNLLVVDHGKNPLTGNRVYTMYEHNSKLLVHKNTKVWLNAGTKIAISGNTGRSTGPHLHYTILEVPYGISYFDIFIILKNDCRVVTDLRNRFSVNPLLYKWW